MRGASGSAVVASASRSSTCGPTREHAETRVQKRTAAAVEQVGVVEVDVDEAAAASARASARARSPSECVVGIAPSVRPDGSSTRAGSSSDAQRSPAARYGGRDRPRRAVDVAELRAGLGDLDVRVPAAAAEERRGEPELPQPRPSSRTRSPVPAAGRPCVVGRGPVRVVAERARGPPPRARARARSPRPRRAPRPAVA